MALQVLTGKAFTLEEVPSFGSGGVQHNNTWTFAQEAKIARVAGKVAVLEPHQRRRQDLMKSGTARSFLRCRGLYWEVCAATRFPGQNHKLRHISPMRRGTSRYDCGFLRTSAPIKTVASDAAVMIQPMVRRSPSVSRQHCREPVRNLCPKALPPRCKALRLGCGGWR